ncbi:hypothetical protein SDC9_187167 [bioreactor metagenome]|uniref:Uncharacterized protein n=1 Tax=bioreactor metagenome TaxID=1076179 RepID=A0A645HN17_9ZZZZ
MAQTPAERRWPGTSRPPPLRRLRVSGAPVPACSSCPVPGARCPGVGRCGVRRGGVPCRRWIGSYNIGGVKGEGPIPGRPLCHALIRVDRGPTKKETPHEGQEREHQEVPRRHLAERLPRDLHGSGQVHRLRRAVLNHPGGGQCRPPAVPRGWRPRSSALFAARCGSSGPPGAAAVELWYAARACWMLRVDSYSWR